MTDWQANKPISKRIQKYSIYYYYYFYSLLFRFMKRKSIQLVLLSYRTLNPDGFVFLVKIGFKNNQNFESNS